MTPAIAAIVLAAAIMHASWNALVKGARDRTVMLGLIAMGHVVPGLAIVLSVPFPGWRVVPFIIASTVIHWGYYWLLNVSYRLGDLSVIYPVARGLAPVLVALGAQVWVGEALPVAAWAGIATVSAGILLLTRSAARHLPRVGLAAAVACAVTVAGYSLVDGVGIRASETALGYIGWLFVSELPVAAFVFVTRSDRLRALGPRVAVAGFLGGVISATAYGLVLFAKTQAPLGVVAALRETSVIFAAAIGLMWFGERPLGNRLAAAVVVAAGIGLIALNG